MVKPNKMQLKVLILLCFRFFICSETIDIAKLYSDSYHCYANSLMQCLKNTNELYFLQVYNFRSSICHELSVIFKDMQNYNYMCYHYLLQEKIRNYKIQKEGFRLMNEHEKKVNSYHLKNQTQNKNQKSFVFCLDLRSSYNKLIDIINHKGLNSQQANDPIEFLELLLVKCKNSFYIEDQDLHRKFLCILNGSYFFSFGFNMVDIQYELLKSLKNVTITRFPNIAIFVNNNILLNFNEKYYYIFKILYMKDVKYKLKSFLVNKYGHNGHFFSVLYKHGRFIKVDNDKIINLPNVGSFKGVYAFFYEKERNYY